MFTGSREIGLGRRVIRSNGVVTSDAFFPTGMDSMQFSSVEGSRKVPHPFSYSLTETREAQGSQTVLRVSDGSEYSYIGENLIGHVVLPTSPYEIDIGQLRNSALSAFVANIKASNFNAGVALGELKETASIGSSLLKLTNRFLNVVPKGALLRDLSGALSDAWLTYSYGVRPLISDIHSLLDLQPRDRYEFSVKTSRTRTFSGRHLLKDNHNWNVVAKDQEKVTVRFTARVSIDNPVTDFAARIGALNPASIAWELVPLSFVADWFFDVGSILDVLGAHYLCPYTIVGSETTFRSHQSNMTCALEESDGLMQWLVSYNGTRRRIFCQRDPFTGIPLPSFPKPRVPTGASQLLSAASLLRQRFF